VPEPTSKTDDFTGGHFGCDGGPVAAHPPGSFHSTSTAAVSPSASTEELAARIAGLFFELRELQAASSRRAVEIEAAARAFQDLASRTLALSRDLLRAAAELSALAVRVASGGASGAHG
jgi:hypothetical protein